jgi:hypothetical protein
VGESQSNCLQSREIVGGKDGETKCCGFCLEPYKEAYLQGSIKQEEEEDKVEREFRC